MKVKFSLDGKRTKLPVFGQISMTDMDKANFTRDTSRVTWQVDDASLSGQRCSHL